MLTRVLSDKQDALLREERALLMRLRTALTRKYVDGESLETLASELGISVDAAKSLLARARRAFRDTFATLSANLSEVSP